MTGTVRQLIVGGVTVPVWAMTTISQRYEKIEAKSRRRFLNGDGWQRTTYSGKLRTIISGSGLIPASLHEDVINYDGEVEISCVEHRGIISTSPSILITANRRTDAGSEPYGRALVGDRWVDTPVVMSVNTATCTTVTGATQYQVIYFPRITVHMDSPPEDKPEHGPTFNWSITADEV